MHPQLQSVLAAPGNTQQLDAITELLGVHHVARTHRAQAEQAYAQWPEHFDIDLTGCRVMADGFLKHKTLQTIDNPTAWAGELFEETPEGSRYGHLHDSGGRGGNGGNARTHGPLRRGRSHPSHGHGVVGYENRSAGHGISVARETNRYANSANSSG
jgi:hypothetical protein